MQGPIATETSGSLAPRATSRSIVRVAISSSVPFQPECTAATVRVPGSASSTGTQSAVFTPTAAPALAVKSASASPVTGGSVPTGAGAEASRIVAPCTCETECSSWSGISVAAANRRRFSSTRRGSSFTEKPRFNDAYGPSDTPPSRVEKAWGTGNRSARKITGELYRPGREPTTVAARTRGVDVRFDIVRQRRGESRLSAMKLRPNSIGKKLLWSIALPGTLVALAGVGFYWLQAEKAVRTSSERQAVALAELISNTFELTARTEPRGAEASSPHRAVTDAFRSNWSTFRNVADLRVLDRQGVVRWSRKIEEEGRLLPDAPRVLSAANAGPMSLENHRTEVVRPLGGMACAGCHQGESTMKAGVIQLTIDEPSLYQEVTSLFREALSSVVLFAIVLALATALSLHFFLGRPLRKLARAMNRAEEGDFLVRAEAHDQDELGRLGLAFNSMLARLTSMKADEIDKARDLEAAQEQLGLKAELEASKAKLERRITELSLLYDVARSFTATLELPELFARITGLVAERLRIPQFSIMVVNAENKLETKSAYPPRKGSEGVTFEIGEGACGKAGQSLMPVYIPDLASDTETFVRREEGTRETGSLLCVPMVLKDQLLGVLNLQRPEVDAFQIEEIELLSAVADQAAMAVKNARLHEETVELSLTDPLTGVPNRRSLFARLEMEVARANRFGHQVSVVMIDIDHFKHLNDIAGHRAGDEILKRVASVMRGMVRRVDILARYGGEEFMLVLPQVGKAEAAEVAEKLRRAVAEAPLPHREAQPEGKVTISLGIANLPADATVLENLVDSADAALYASKRAGRNRVTGYQLGMELHPGRERGPNAQKRTRTGESAAS